MIGISPYIFNALYDWLRDNDYNPRVVVDANAPGVVVPQEYVNNGIIIISIYHKYINDFQVGEQGIRFYARFKGQERYVGIPYQAMIEISTANNGIYIPVSNWLESMEHTFSALSREIGEDDDGDEDKDLSSKSDVQFVLEEYDGSAKPAKSKGRNSAKDDNKNKPSFTILS